MSKSLITSGKDWFAGGLGKAKTVITAQQQLAKLASGLTPVFRIETCKNINDKDSYIGDRILVDSFPWYVTIKDADKAIFGKIKKLAKNLRQDAMQAFGELFTGAQRESPLIGVMIDSGTENPWRYIANMIFQNVLIQSPKGNKWLCEDFLELGYPVRITIGYLTPRGEFIQHPHDSPITAAKDILPDYTGVIGSMTQETFRAGDRFQCTAFGFEYLLSRMVCDKFEATADTSLRRVLGELLYEWATGERRKGRTRKTDDAKKPIPILKAMGIADDSGRVYGPSTIARTIRVIDSKKWPKLKKRYEWPINRGSTPEKIEESSAPHMRRRESASWLDVMKDFESDHYSDHVIYFDYQGRLTIQGKNTTTSKIASGFHKPTENPDRTRIHHAVIGSNVIHLKTECALEQMAGTVQFYTYDDKLTASPPTFGKVEATYSRSLTPTAALKQYGGPDFGQVVKVYYSPEKETDEEVDVEELDQDIIDRYKYWGMRGTSYMIANTKIQVGDVVRITDIRDKTGFGTTLGTAIDLGKDILDKVKSIAKDRFAGLDITKFRAEKTYLGLRAVEDFYYIWKVRHYVGQDMITTKVFFVKEPDSLVRLSSALMKHRALRGKIRGEEEPT